MKTTEEDLKKTTEHNAEFMRQFQEQATARDGAVPRAAIIIGASEGGGVQLGFTNGLSHDQVVQLLIVAVEGFISVGGPGPARKVRTC